MINLRFLGTGGLGAVRLRNKLSKDYRRFSTLLIDEKIIIDPSEDVFEFVESFLLGGILDDVKDVFITHSHPDSFSPMAIERLAKMHPIRVYIEDSLKDELTGIPNIEIITISPFTLRKINNFSILALPSNHTTENPDEIPLNFLIESQSKTIFYGIDGAFINPSAWNVLKEIHLDVAVLDFALGIADYSNESAYHNNLKSVSAIREIFVASDIADESTQFILSHVPSGKKSPSHDQVYEALRDTPFRIAYDGYFLGI